jgi:cytochrome c oxidase accessory protein FixG
MSIPPVYDGRVLPTLNADGTRRQMRPEQYPGRFLNARRIVGLGLIGLFVIIPLLRMNGKPLMLLDVVERRFTLFGRTFLPTDGVLLMFLMLSLFVGIIALTAVLGRAWCGWGCPQTVYMEFLFRPIERLFEGNARSQAEFDKRGGGLRRVLKNVTFLLLSVIVGNVFLAYFVGTDRLFSWIAHSPAQHPEGFVVMAVTAGLVFFDFAYFREQMCTVICPYARLQSALLDKDSLIIGYDEKRGEPRSLGKPKPGHGDCIDCKACVRACPTGIDIRKGLQLECIACAQCVDACDSIMARIDKPKGLIRYASQRTLGEGVRRLWRPRVAIYAVIVTALLTALVSVGGSRTHAQVTVLRGVGAPYLLVPQGVQTQLRIKIENHESTDETYQVELSFGKPGHEAPASTLSGQVIFPENPVHVPGLGRRMVGGFVTMPEKVFENGQLPVTVKVTDKKGVGQTISYKLLGPVR